MKLKELVQLPYDLNGPTTSDSTPQDESEHARKLMGPEPGKPERELKSASEPEQVALFVDAENATRPFRLHAGQLKGVLAQGRKVAVAIWRDSYRDPHDYRRKMNYYKSVGRSFVVKPVPLKRNGNGIAKSRVDAYLMVDMLTRLLEEELGEQPRTRTWVLVSGDSDFQPVLELLKARGRRVEVAFTDPEGLAHELKATADRLIDLTRYRDAIEYKPLTCPSSAPAAPPPQLDAKPSHSSQPHLQPQPQTQTQPSASVSVPQSSQDPSRISVRVDLYVHLDQGEPELELEPEPEPESEVDCRSRRNPKCLGRLRKLLPFLFSLFPLLKGKANGDGAKKLRFTRRTETEASR